MYLAKTPRSRLTTTSPESSLHARIEAYSCKATNKDKKLYRSIDHHWEDEVAFKSASPNHPSTATILDSPFGPLDQPQARRTFCLLIATLNVAFPDHDFSDISPDQFARETNGGAPILNALSNALTAPRDASNHHLSSCSFAAFPASYAESKEDSFRSSSPITSILHQLHQTPPAAIISHPALYRILTDVVTLSECEVYTYSPDVYSDPHGGCDSDTDSLASSDYDSLDGWEWDDYDVDDMPQSFTDSIHSGHKKNDIDPWDLSTSPDRDIVLPHNEPVSKRRRRGGSLPYYSSQRLPLPRSFATTPATSMSRSTAYDSYEFANYRQCRRKGGLLWSTHWFFFHRKEKKILFVTLWARQREWTSGGDALVSSLQQSQFGERFGGWEGAEGAGMRAFESALEDRGRTHGRVQARSVPSPMHV